MSRPRDNTGAHFLADLARVELDADGKIPANSFLYLVSILRSIIEKINGNISFAHSGVDGEWTGNIDGQLRIITFPSTYTVNTQFRVEHGLGRKPVAFYFSSLSLGASAVATELDRASWNEEEIFIRSNAGGGTAVTFHLLIL